MKVFVALCVLSVAAMAWARPDTYTDKYDTLDIQQILANDRTVESYHKCMMDQGKCTAEGKELKAHIKEALENHCAKCTEIQKDRVYSVMRFLIEEKPQYWIELCGKYDPKNVYRTKYEAELKNLSKH